MGEKKLSLPSSLWKSSKSTEIYRQILMQRGDVIASVPETLLQLSPLVDG
jgi:hypothetical protein